MPAFVTTVLGLVLVVAGLGYSVAAYHRANAEHGDRPLWPRLRRAWVAVRRVWVQYVLRRPPIQGRMSATAPAATVTGSGTVTFADPQIDADLPVEEQLRLVIDRLKAVESRTSSDRAQFTTDLHEIRHEINTQVTRLRAADEETRSLVRAVAADPVTLKYQLRGLFLVGLGTVLMAIPALASAWPLA